jgi:hypothetical protein
VTERRQGWIALGVLGLAAVALIAVELSKGALDYGESTILDPCTDERPPFPGDGFDATVQRIVLDGLDGAACELGATREELVLAFDPDLSDDEVRWDQETIERAVRSGLLRSIDDAEERDDIGGIPATILREVVERAPLDLLIRGGEALGGLLERFFDRR